MPGASNPTSHETTVQRATDPSSPNTTVGASIGPNASRVFKTPPTISAWSGTPSCMRARRSSFSAGIFSPRSISCRAEHPTAPRRASTSC